MLEPLTRRRTDGTAYKRRADIERRLENLLSKGRADQLAELRVRDRGASNYVPTECLVYLLRRADRDNSPHWFNALFTILRNRCKLRLETTIHSNGMVDDKSLREEALSRFEMFFATGLRKNPEKLDVLEVAFNLAFAAMRKDLFTTEAGRAARFVELRVPGVDEGDEALEFEFAQPLPALAQELGMEESEFEVFRSESLRSIIVLPEDERDAILLLLQGFPISSKDTSKDTIAKRQGVDERTVRNRIARGIKRLNERGTSK